MWVVCVVMMMGFFPPWYKDQAWSCVAFKADFGQQRGLETVCQLITLNHSQLSPGSISGKVATPWMLCLHFFFGGGDEAGVGNFENWSSALVFSLCWVGLVLINPATLKFLIFFLFFWKAEKCSYFEFSVFSALLKRCFFSLLSVFFSFIVFSFTSLLCPLDYLHFSGFCSVLSVQDLHLFPAWGSQNQDANKNIYCDLNQTDLVKFPINFPFYSFHKPALDLALFSCL